MHSVSESDLRFWAKFEACQLTGAEFGHREHLRIAYIYLAQHSFPEASRKMEAGLRKLLAHLGAPASKYHATVTIAWLLALRDAMAKCGAAADFQQFLDAGGARLLDKTMMAAHYSPEVLSSPEARRAFVAPDRQKFPDIAR
jgi:hypothetical protein